MRRLPSAGAATTLFLIAAFAVTRPLWGDEPPARIAFGSCILQTRPVPILEEVAEQAPGLFVFLGDNVYADTTDPQAMRRAYARLSARPEFRALLAACPVEATWDDHDYGANDAGADFPGRRMSQRIFLDFWDIPPGSPRRSREGVYGSRLFGPADRRVQLILLDTRSFRSPPKRHGSLSLGHGPYVPTDDPSATILGEDQWLWLEARLREPADVRIVASSIQFSAQFHGWESWANFPGEQKRFVELIRRTGAQGLLFISGDRHMAELSRLDPAGLYPLYDLTSSGLNRSYPVSRPSANANRVGPAYLEVNFGEILINWDESPPSLTLRILDAGGRPQLVHRVSLAELQTR